jgi:transcriptional regulator GlxA family with amidase domain
MRTKRIAVLGYDDVQALDIAGPLDAFDMANRGTHADRPNYQTLLLGVTNRSFRSEAGINFKPNAAIDRVGEIDTLIIPGGRSLRTSEMGSRVATAVKRFGAHTRRPMSLKVRRRQRYCVSRRLPSAGHGASHMHSHPRRCAHRNKAMCWVDSDRAC